MLEARRIVETDWEMTNCDAVHVHVLDRRTALLAEELGTTPDELDAFVESYF